MGFPSSIYSTSSTSSSSSTYYNGELARDPSSYLPDETMLYIFSFLDFNAQAAVSLVDKRWREIVKDDSLDFKKPFYVIEIAAKRCRTFTSESIAGGSLLAVGSKFVLVSKIVSKLVSNLFVINKKSIDVIKVDFKNEIDEKQSFKFATFFSETKFIAAIQIETRHNASQGKLILCEICDKVVKLVKKIDIFDKGHFVNMIVLNNEILVKWLNKIVFVDTYSLDLDIKLESKNFKSFKDLPEFIFHNTSRIFEIELNPNRRWETNGKIMSCYYLDTLNAFLIGTKMTFLENLRLVRVNDQWIVLANCPQLDETKKSEENGYPYTAGILKENLVFHFFDTKTHQENFKFELDYRELPPHYSDLFNHQRYSPGHEDSRQESNNTSCWLSNDFFIIWCNKELRIWHIPTQRSLRPINLEGLLPADELNIHKHYGLYVKYTPIINVEIDNKAVYIFVKRVKFRKDKDSINMVKLELIEP